MAGADSQGGVPSGWYEDPTKRHQWRFWDGATWTEHVAHDGQASTDLVDPGLRRAIDQVVDEGSGSTRLHLACSHGDLEQVRALLSQGADPNVVNMPGATPLDLTYSNGADMRYRAIYAQIAQLLKARGARTAKWRGPTF
jgi:hypothetical protein